jgi:hypothetical protein
MGTRINKVLGWGLKYCKFERDPRFRPAFFEDGELSYLEQMVSENKKHLKSKDLGKRMDSSYFDWWVNGTGAFSDTGKTQTELSRHDVFQFNSYTDTTKETGAVVFTDPSNRGWYRHDDIMDYYDAPAGAEGAPLDSVKFILDGAGQPAQIYPYCSFVNRHTGKSAKENINQSDRWSITNMYFKYEHKDWKWKVFEKNWGVKNIIQWQRDIVPEPPYVIRLFCKVAKPFKDPLMIYRLKPMILTYWC